MPRQLGPRFALEAAFLILVAVGAGLLDVRPLLIVLVMAVAWLLVALMEYAASREAPRYAVRRGTYGPLPEEAPVVQGQIVEDRPSPTLLEPPPARAGQTADESVTEATPAPSAEPRVTEEATAQPSEPAEAGRRVELSGPETVAAETEPAEPSGSETVVAETGAAEPTTFAAERPPMRYRLEPLRPRPKRRWLWQRKGEARAEEADEKSADAADGEPGDDG